MTGTCLWEPQSHLYWLHSTNRHSTLEIQCIKDYRGCVMMSCDVINYCANNRTLPPG